MRRALIYLAVVLCVLLAILASRKGDAGQEVYIESVVQLYTSSTTCTGFIVARGMIATAGHCIHETDPIKKVVFDDGVVVDYKVISLTNKGDCTHDWALIAADTGKRHAVSFTRSPDMGSPVYRVGHPMGQRIERLKKGVLLTQIGNEVEMSGIAIPGESGGPIFDSTGRVFGIVNCYEVINRSAIGGKVGDLVRLVVLMKRGQR